MHKNPLITPADLTPDYLRKREKLLADTLNSVEPLSVIQTNQLKSVSQKNLYENKVQPCKVELNNGKVIDNVILNEINHYVEKGGVWRATYNFPNELKITSIKNIYCSDNLIPKAISDKISKLDETGMGYTVFYFLFQNGLRKQAVCGGQAYFFEFEKKYKIENLVDVEPFIKENDKRDKFPINSSMYYFGFYATQND